MRHCWLAALSLALLSGCAQVGYLGQAVGGHLELLARAKPVDEWLAQPDLAPALRERLALSQQMREFAVRELALPDNASYRRYADLQRPAVVWNVVAAPELSLRLKTWCYPLMGCAGYRGFFAREQAEALAAELRAEGWDVWVYGVPAYSTLGWTNWLGGDPLLSTFIRYPEPELAGLIFHELAHQVLYVADDTAFNESYASAVEQLGLQAWLAQRGAQGPIDAAAHALRQQRRAEFQALTARYRQQLDALYRSRLAPQAQRERKAELLAALRAAHAALRDGPWGGDKRYDSWMAGASNASLAIQAAYSDLTPAFVALFERQQRDWGRFHAEVRRLAALPPEQRRRELGDDGGRAKPQP